MFQLLFNFLLRRNQTRSTKSHLRACFSDVGGNTEQKHTPHFFLRTKIEMKKRPFGLCTLFLYVKTKDDEETFHPQKAEKVYVNSVR